MRKAFKPTIRWRATWNPPLRRAPALEIMAGRSVPGDGIRLERPAAAASTL